MCSEDTGRDGDWVESGAYKEQSLSSKCPAQENWKPPSSHSAFVLVHNHYEHARSYDHVVSSWPNALLAWFQTPTTPCVCVCVHTHVRSCLSVYARTHTQEAKGQSQIPFLCTAINVIFVKCDHLLAGNSQVGYAGWPRRFRNPPIPDYDYEVLGLWGSNSFFFFSLRILFLTKKITRLLC